jgi:hypothetical protein
VCEVLPRKPDTSFRGWRLQARWRDNTGESDRNSVADYVFVIVMVEIVMEGKTDKNDLDWPNYESDRGRRLDWTGFHGNWGD